MGERKARTAKLPQGPVRGEKKSCSGCFQSQNARVKMEMRPTLLRLHAFRGLGEDGGFVYFRVPRRRRSCPGAAKEPEWAAGTRRHRRDSSPSVAHRAKEEVSSRVAASPRRIGSADPSSRLGSWSRVAPRLPQKTLKSQLFEITSFYGGQQPAGLKTPCSYTARRKIVFASCFSCFKICADEKCRYDN